MPAPSPTTDRGISALTPEEVLAELSLLLVLVIGDEFLLAADVGMDTTFTDDLCLESIQFVLLAEELRDRYGDDVDFVGWLAGMDLDGIIALRVGQLVELIVGSVNGAQDG